MSDTVISQWVEAKEALDYYKKRELELRNQVVSSSGELKAQGTNNVFFEGQSCKIVTRLNVKPDPIRYTTLTCEDVFPESDVEVSDICIVWKPSVSTTVYKGLTDSQRFKVDSNLIVKPGQATLAVVEGE